jgi:hypothetical protein
MHPDERTRLVEAVQTNCHIADARHAADMTLCTYLLQMREFHRWERGLPFGAALPRDELGAWIADRETLWSSLEEQAFLPVPCTSSGGSSHAALDPFEAEAVNARLRPQGLLYGAGLVGAQRPVFFLAELHAQGQREGLDVLSAGHELARGLLAPPATLSSGERGPIVLRRESLARACWEKFEAFALRPAPGSAFHAVVQAYGLDRDFEAAMPRWLDEQAEAMLLHELGEHRVGRMLGPDWAALRLDLPTRRADLYARAVRDQLADLGFTLPTLLERDAAASIHFWFATYDGVREMLFPSLKTAYAAWTRGDNGHALRHAAATGEAHFTRLARKALGLHLQGGEPAGAGIERLLTSSGAVCAG